MERIIGILVVFLSLILVGIIVFLKMKNKIGLLPLVFSVFGLIIVFIFSYNLFFYFNDTEVSIKLSSTEGSESFILHEKNHKIRYEYTYSQFSSTSTLDEIKESIIDTYPLDVVSIDNKEVKIIHNNQVIKLKEIKSEQFLWQKRHVYTLASQYIPIEIQKNKIVYLPFPKEYLDTDSGYHVSMNIKCDIEELKKYYEDFTNVEFINDTIVLTLEEPIILSIENGKIIIQYK